MTNTTKELRTRKVQLSFTDSEYELIEMFSDNRVEAIGTMLRRQAIAFYTEQLNENNLKAKTNEL